MFPCRKRSISLLNDQVTQARENLSAFPEHLYHLEVEIHPQSRADGRQLILNRLRDGPMGWCYTHYSQGFNDYGIIVRVSVPQTPEAAGAPASCRQLLFLPSFLGVRV